MNTTPTPVAAAPARPKLADLKPGAAAPEIFEERDRLTILTPTYDYALTEFYHNSLRACTESVKAHFRQPDGTVVLKPVIAERINVPNDSHIDRARNVITNVWLANPARTRFALSIDADIEFFPEDIARTWLHLMRGIPFVCGHYAMKCLLPTFVANIVPGARPDPESGLIQLMDGGTGWMAHEESVFFKLRTHPEVKAYDCAPNSPFAGQVHHAFYSSGVYGPKDAATGRAQWLSEDWKLCRLWQELGGKVMGDTQIKLRHFGRMLYPPTVAELEDAYLSLVERRHPALNLPRLATACAKAMPPKAA